MKYDDEKYGARVNFHYDPDMKKYIKEKGKSMGLSIREMFVLTIQFVMNEPERRNQWTCFLKHEADAKRGALRK